VVRRPAQGRVPPQAGGHGTHLRRVPGGEIGGTHFVDRRRVALNSAWHGRAKPERGAASRLSPNPAPLFPRKTPQGHRPGHRLAAAQGSPTGWLQRDVMAGGAIDLHEVALSEILDPSRV
jgi:hypothetical protein